MSIPTQSVLSGNSKSTTLHNNQKSNNRNVRNGKRNQNSSCNKRDANVQPRLSITTNSYQRPPNSNFKYRQVSNTRVESNIRANTFSTPGQTNIRYGQTSFEKVNNQTVTQSSGQMNGQFISTLHIYLNSLLSESSEQINSWDVNNIHGMTTQTIPNLHGKINSLNLHMIVDQLRQMNNIMQIQKSATNGEQLNKEGQPLNRNTQKTDHSRVSIYMNLQCIQILFFSNTNLGPSIQFKYN